MCSGFSYFVFFKQKTAYEMRISDWSSDVCSSDLLATLTDERFSREDWLFEPKWDGERCLAFRLRGDLRLYSRNRKQLNEKYPEKIGRASCRESVCQYV